ncbi:MAG: manganese catalase [Cypionkella sp.]|nr:manganese catalase [Cypionkella sp.]
MVGKEKEQLKNQQKGCNMFLRVDKLQIELPAPLRADPNAGAALQELLGGKYGEMSTLGNYMFQSFNFRSKSKLRPFYSLVAAITAEELGHVELVSNGVAMLNNGPDTSLDEEYGGDISGAPYEMMADVRLAAAFFSNGGGAVPVNSNGQSWNNDFVTTTGNVIFDLLHNFHLECGARLHKLRVYESLTDPTGREVCGYLLVRGSVHAHAYALALKKITGVSIEKMLPVPNIPLGNIPECQKYLEEGSHRRLYTFSPDDYQEMSGIWGNGEVALPDDPPGELTVVEGMPDGGKIQQLNGVPSAFTPDYAPEEMYEIAAKLYQASR